MKDKYVLNNEKKKNTYSGIYEDFIAKKARELTKDTHLQKDLEQEMRLMLVRMGKCGDKFYSKNVAWYLEKRAQDFLRKFLKGEIPSGDMEDIENLSDNI